MGLSERVADPHDPLRALLQAARRWQVPPTVFLRIRTVEIPQWTDADTSYAMALEDYEAGLCPGGNHPLSETTKAEHANAYVGGEVIECYHCTGQGRVSAAAEKDENRPAGLLVHIVLDPEVVALNRLPVPPLPPELMPTT